jgi:hypothetical protein
MLPLKLPGTPAQLFFFSGGKDVYAVHERGRPMRVNKVFIRDKLHPVSSVRSFLNV